MVIVIVVNNTMVYTDKIHLIADTLEELHKFANKIGMNKEWFQNHIRHPHYDIFGIMLTKTLNDKDVKVIGKKELLIRSKMLGEGRSVVEN